MTEYTNCCECLTETDLAETGLTKTGLAEMPASSLWILELIALSMGYFMVKETQ